MRYSRYRSSDNMLATLEEARHNGNPLPPRAVSPNNPNAPIQQICTERLLALTRFVDEEYNIDPMHTRLILSGLLPSNFLPVWMIYETTTTPFWNHLRWVLECLDMPPIVNVSKIRILRARTSNATMLRHGLSRHESPRIYTDTHYLDTRQYRGRCPEYHGYWEIARECLRAVVHAPMLRIPRPEAAEELLRLVRMVLSDPTGMNVRPMPEPVVLSRPLAEMVGLLCRFNEEVAEGEVPYTTTALLVSGHAALYGRSNSQLQDEDWLNAMQAVRGSIRRWMKDILYWFYMQDSKGRTWVREMQLLEKLGGNRNIMRFKLYELVRLGICELKKIKNRHYYALTELGSMGATLVGAGTGVRWW